jgi:hypothetical protein
MNFLSVYFILQCGVFFVLKYIFLDFLYLELKHENH